MHCQPPNDSPFDLDQLKRDYAFTPGLDELAAVVAVWSHPTRLRIFALLDHTEQICVCDLASVLGVSVSAVSQNLAKMRALRLVQFRREAQTLYYSLSDHPVTRALRPLVLAARDSEGL